MADPTWRTDDRAPSADFRRSSSSVRGPGQQKHQEAFWAYPQREYRPKTKENWFYFHGRGVPEKTTRWQQRTTGLQTRKMQVRNQPDPQFSLKVGTIYKIIKAKHHMNQVSKECPPKFIIYFKQLLGNKIRPAMASDFIKQDIWKNANEWHNHTLSSLKKHYHMVIQEQLQVFFNLPDIEWQLPFQVAQKWASTSLGRRLQQDTLLQTKQLLAGGAGKTELNTLQPTGVQLQHRLRQPATQPQTTGGLPQSPALKDNKLCLLEKTMNKLTCLMENFKGTRTTTSDGTTQTGRKELTTCGNITHTEVKELVTHHTHTQTGTTKRRTKGIGIQVQPSVFTMTTGTQASHLPSTLIQPPIRKVAMTTQTGTPTKENRGVEPEKEKRHTYLKGRPTGDVWRGEPAKKKTHLSGL